MALQRRVGGEELARGCAAAGYEDGEAVPVQPVGRVVLENKGQIERKREISGQEDRYKDKRINTWSRSVFSLAFMAGVVSTNVNLMLFSPWSSITS